MAFRFSTLTTSESGLGICLSVGTSGDTEWLNFEFELTMGFLGVCLPLIRRREKRHEKYEQVTFVRQHPHCRRHADYLTAKTLSTSILQCLTPRIAIVTDDYVVAARPQAPLFWNIFGHFQNSFRVF